MAEITTGYHGHIEYAGGFLKAYTKFPWVSENHHYSDLCLIDGMTHYWAFDDNCEDIEEYWTNDRYPYIYIRPKDIKSIKEGTDEDWNGILYSYSELTLYDGSVLWLPEMWWVAMQEENDGEEPTT